MKPPLGSRKMKKLVATIVLLCLSSTVLAHDIYSNLRDRDGNPCCGGQDCMPVEAIVLPDGNYYLPKTDEVISATWQHHRLMIVSTIVIIQCLQWQMGLTPMDQFGNANSRLDAS